MSRPTLGLCCILKNELKNIPRLLASLKDCFDEIHLTDTGSTDGSIELIESYLKDGKNPSGCPLFLHHFTWVDDFSAARNASFAPCKTDYLMWLDLDDVLANTENFIYWRDTVMKLGDFWLATYHYALDAQGKPKCSFARERVVKRSLEIPWQYFVHEGMLPVSKKQKDLAVQYATTWSVKHLRDEEDRKQDKSRNLKLFEKHKANLDYRMRYYLGKELFENGKHLEAFTELMTAIAAEELQMHDRIMGIQYAVMSAMMLNQFEKAIALGFQGLQLDPNRAEYYTLIGDCYLKSGKMLEAIPFYTAASVCQYRGDQPMQGAIFSQIDAYGHYPLNQLARIYANMAHMDKAEALAKQALERGENAESRGILGDIEMLKSKVHSSSKRKPMPHLIITTPPNGLYAWDGEIYRNKGIGGSETAAVEMAEWFSKLSPYSVIVFNQAGPIKKLINGVEYRPVTEIPEYLRDYSPVLHIAWRHGMKLSDDPYYVWCHDLAALGMEHQSYDKVLALSPFHRDFLMNICGVPKEKILITRNGIDPKRFLGPKPNKTPFKIIYSSSPDRGLTRAIKVMDKVVKTYPEAKLHVFYGFDNMMKMGMHAQAEAIQREMANKDYIVYHGNRPQRELTKEMQTACVWLYPTNFLETFCITAIEALCSHTYPVVRKWGGLEWTLKQAHEKGMADVLDKDCETDEDIKAYADAVCQALEHKKWENMTIDPNQFSWESVAMEWLELLEANHATSASALCR